MAICVAFLGVSIAILGGYYWIRQLQRQRQRWQFFLILIAALVSPSAMLESALDHGLAVVERGLTVIEHALATADRALGDLERVVALLERQQAEHPEHYAPPILIYPMPSRKPRQKRGGDGRNDLMGGLLPATA